MKSRYFAGRLILLILALAVVAAIPLAAMAWPNNLQTDVKAHSIGDGSSVEMSNSNIPQGKPGDTIVLEIPLHIEFNYQDNDDKFFSEDLYTDDQITYSGVKIYEPKIYQVFERLAVTINTSNGDALPFEVDPDEDYGREYILYDENNNPYNAGYAVYELTLREDAEAGSYVIPLTVEWIDFTGKKKTDTKHFKAIVTVQAKSTSSGSSGGGWSGGGGGGGTEAAQPQAKLMVASITTEPELPKAGQEFEMILVLRNTSESQYLQNIKMTYAAEEDLVMPISGTNSVYIKRIEKNQDHEVRLKVKAMPEVTGQPIKVEVNFEFEDGKVNALTETQTLVLNVEQPMRFEIDDPVMPAAAPYAGDQVEFTVRVYNLGRPTMYNVMARVVQDNENLVQTQSGFGGPIETGTDKVLEMEVVPMTEGEYTMTVEISFEDADGNKYVEPRTTTFYALALDEYDPDEDFLDLPEEPEEPEEPTAMLIMQSLPWWLYAAIGGILFILILSMGIGARRRRRKGFEDDEMD